MLQLSIVCFQVETFMGDISTLSFNHRENCSTKGLWKIGTNVIDLAIGFYWDGLKYKYGYVVPLKDLMESGTNVRILFGKV